MRIKQMVVRTPLVGRVARLVRRATSQAGFSSADYWEQRYRAGGTSGAGSYGRLAEFKAAFLNQFVAEHGVRSVIEFGCGDGNQLESARYPSYVGLDVAPSAVDACSRRFAGDHTKRFELYGAGANQVVADMSLSLDVIYHLVEDDVFEKYMHDLFAAARDWVIVYASDVDRRTATHVRHRRFSRWVAANEADWQLVERVPNPFGTQPDDVDPDRSPADFFVFHRSPASTDR